MDPLKTTRPSDSHSIHHVPGSANSAEERANNAAHKSMFSSSLYDTLAAPFRFLAHQLPSGGSFDKFARFFFGSGLPTLNDPIREKDLKSIILSDDGTKTVDLVEERLDLEWNQQILPKLSNADIPYDLERGVIALQKKCKQRLQCLKASKKTFPDNLTKLGVLQKQIQNNLETRFKKLEEAIPESQNSKQLINSLTQYRSIERLLDKHSGTLCKVLNEPCEFIDRILADLSNTAINPDLSSKQRLTALNTFVDIWSSYPTEKFSQSYAIVIKQIRELNKTEPNQSLDVDKHLAQLGPTEHRALRLLTRSFDTPQTRVEESQKILNKTIEAFDQQDVQGIINNLNLLVKLTEIYPDSSEFHEAYATTIDALVAKNLPAKPEILDSLVVGFESHMAVVKGTDFEQKARTFRQKFLEAPLQESLQQPIHSVADIEKRLNFLDAAHEFHTTAVSAQDSVYNPQTWLETIAQNPPKDIKAFVSSNSEKLKNEQLPLAQRVQALQELSGLAGILYANPEIAIGDEIRRLEGIIDDVDIPTSSEKYEQTTLALQALQQTIQEGPTLKSILTTFDEVATKLQQQTEALISADTKPKQLLDQLQTVISLAQSVDKQANQVAQGFRHTLVLLGDKLHTKITSKFNDGSTPLSTDNLQDLYNIKQRQIEENQQNYERLEEKTTPMRIFSDIRPTLQDEEEDGVYFHQKALDKTIFDLDINTAFAKKLDTNLLALGSQLSSISQEQAKLSQEKTTLETNIASVKEEIEAFKISIEKFSMQMTEEIVQPLEQQLGAVQESISTLKNNITTLLNNSLATQSPIVADLQTTLDNLTQQIKKTGNKKERQGLEETLQTLSGDLNTQKKELEALQKKIEGLTRASTNEAFLKLAKQAPIPADTEAFSTILDAYSRLATKQKNLEQQLKKSTKINKEKVTVASQTPIKEGLTALRSELSSREQALTTMEQDMISLGQKITDFDSQISELKKQQTSSTQQLNKLQQTESQLKTTLPEQWVKTIRSNILDTFSIFLGYDPALLQKDHVRDVITDDKITELLNQSKESLVSYRSSLGEAAFEQGFKTIQQELKRAVHPEDAA